MLPVENIISELEVLKSWVTIDDRHFEALPTTSSTV